MARPKVKDPLERIVSLKVSAGQLRKIGKLKRKLQKAEGKKISQSEVIRRLIEQAA